MQAPGNDDAAARAERALTSPFAAFATRPARIALGLGVLLVVVALAAPKRHRLVVQPLLNPVAVTGWTTDSLLLADGREVRLPEVHELPLESAALTALTKRGVEIGPDGRPIGQVRLFSTCGNCDPGARRMFMRVDVADALIFLGVAQTGLPEPFPGFMPESPEGQLYEGAWEIGKFKLFDTWQGLAEAARRKRSSE